jgi:hypothetical protein
MLYSRQVFISLVPVWDFPVFSVSKERCKSVMSCSTCLNWLLWITSSLNIYFDLSSQNTARCAENLPRIFTISRSRPPDYLAIELLSGVWPEDRIHGGLCAVRWVLVKLTKRFTIQCALFPIFNRFKIMITLNQIRKSNVTLKIGWNWIGTGVAEALL